MNDETKNGEQGELPGTTPVHEVLLTAYQDLPVPLCTTELLENADQLAGAYGELESHAAHVKQVQAELNATRKEIEARIQKLTLTQREKKQLRRVQVQHRAFWSEGVVRVVRTDTGETVRSRPIEERERQRTIPGENAPVGGTVVPLRDAAQLVPVDENLAGDLPACTTATGRCLGHSGKLSPEEQLAEHEQRCLGKSVVQAAAEARVLADSAAGAQAPLTATIGEQQDMKQQVDAALRGGKDENHD